jgi:hypothetical protein
VGLYKPRPDESQWWRWSAFALGLTAHAIALVCIYRAEGGSPFYWPYRGFQTLDAPHWAAILAPMALLVLFLILHKKDKSGPGVAGIWRRVEDDDPVYADYAAPSLTRQSINSAIGLGIIAALLKTDALWSDSRSSRSVMAYLTVAMLAVATLFAMVSVVCYAQSSHWKETNAKGLLPIKIELLKKASWFDQKAWYALMTGLVWAVSLIDPALSVWASFAFGVLLFLYYFHWEKWDPKPPVEMPETPDPFGVKPHDYATLEAALTKLGIEATELAELKKAVTDQTKLKAQIAVNLKTWLDTIKQRIETKQLNVGPEATEKILLDLISRYYGLGR